MSAKGFFGGLLSGAGTGIVAQDKVNRDEAETRRQNALKMAALLGQQNKDTRPSSIREFEHLQTMTPEQKEEYLNYKKASSGGATVINQAEAKGLTAEQQALGKSRVKRLEEIQTSAQSAMDQNEKLEQLKNIDVNTGFGEQFKGDMARIFNSLGVDGNKLLGVNVSNIQAFNSVVGQLLAEALAAQKGPQTDKDANRIMQTLPQISNETDAKNFIIRSMQAINDRKIEQAEFYEKILEGEGTLKNADKLWREYKRQTPLLSGMVKDRSSGLPMFFNEFKAQALSRNPGAEHSKIIEAWRGLHK